MLADRTSAVIAWDEAEYSNSLDKEEAGRTQETRQSFRVKRLQKIQSLWLSFKTHFQFYNTGYKGLKCALCCSHTQVDVLHCKNQAAACCWGTEKKSGHHVFTPSAAHWLQQSLIEESNYSFFLKTLTMRQKKKKKIAQLCNTRT